MADSSVLQESPPSYAAEKPKPPGKFKFSPDNARKYNLRGQIARRESFTANTELGHAIKSLARLADMLPVLHAAAESVLPALADPWLKERVQVTRTQLERLEALFAAQCALSEPDPKKIRDIVQAITQLSEVERVLSGRPLPMPTKPDRQPRSSRLTINMPQEPSPQPAPQSATPSLPAEPTTK